MADGFYNRIIGTTVVVAVLVIVLPDMLDGKKQRIQDDFTAIPLQPESFDEPLTVDSFHSGLDRWTLAHDEEMNLNQYADFIEEEIV